MQEGLGFSLGAGIRDSPSPRCAGFLPSQVPLGGFSLLFLPHSLVEPQLRPGDAGGSSDPNPTGHGSCHQHRCAPPGKGSLRPAAGLGPAHVIAMEGKDLPGGRAGQSRASLLRELPAGQEHARICDPGAPFKAAGGLVLAVWNGPRGSLVPTAISLSARLQEDSGAPAP